MPRNRRCSNKLVGIIPHAFPAAFAQSGRNDTTILFFSPTDPWELPELPNQPKRNAARLRLRITAAAEAIVRSGHPWVYADSIREQNRPGAMGELAVVYDRKDRFLALGLFDPDSPIRLRVLVSGKPDTINRAWWSRRLQDALAKRKGLFDEQTTGYRWINGESDGWPGFVLDRYGSTQVMKMYTAAWLPRMEETASLIAEHLAPERLVLRLSRNIQSAAIFPGRGCFSSSVRMMPPEAATSSGVKKPAQPSVMVMRGAPSTVPLKRKRKR